MGVLISTVSQNQGQAIQLAIMFVVPQILLSGLIFPVDAMAAGIRWIAYVLPLTYFVDISRGVMLKAEPITALWIPLVVLLGMAVAVLGLADTPVPARPGPERPAPPGRTSPSSQAVARMTWGIEARHGHLRCEDGGRRRDPTGRPRLGDRRRRR